jgi:hypothetical protein
MFEINEYNTSKLYNKTFKEQLMTKSKVLEEKDMLFLELENVSVRKNKRKKHLHEILTPKEETERCIFVNRDKNACKNILYLGKYFLEYQLRPLQFCKTVKIGKDKTKVLSSSRPKEFNPKPKENNIIIKQRKTRQKKEIVV